VWFVSGILLTPEIIQCSPASIVTEGSYERSIFCQEHCPPVFDEEGNLRTEHFDDRPRDSSLDVGMCLASLEQSGFANSGKFYILDVINDNITRIRRIADLQPSGYIELPFILGLFAEFLDERFQRSSSKEIADLDEAISSLRQAVSLSQGRPACAVHRNNLANILFTRFQQLAERQDIDEAILSHRLAIRSTPDAHPNLPTRYNNLANALLARFEKLGEPEDMDDGLDNHRRAAQLSDNGHPHYAMCLTNLGNALYRRFEYYAERKDLDDAISNHRIAVRIAHDNPRYLHNLSTSLGRRFKSLRQEKDIIEAIALQQRVVLLTSPTDSDLPSRLDHLGDLLCSQFPFTSEKSDIDEALVARRLAVKLLPMEHPDRKAWLNNLD
jgi:tetratricopeptide (TPR) repeat protein